MTRFLLSSLFLLGIQLTAGAQLREVPKEVKAAFENQYPKADSISYDDKLIQVQVHFRQDGERFTASYNNRGEWKETLKDWSFSTLPEPVKDGLSKSKYADWKVTDTKIVYRAGTPERYRLKVEKSELQKKLLLFTPGGRLLEDLITL